MPVHGARLQDILLTTLHSNSLNSTMTVSTLLQVGLYFFNRGIYYWIATLSNFKFYSAAMSTRMYVCELECKVVY